MTPFRSAILACAAALLLSTPALAQDGKCTSETLTIDGQKVAAQFCVTSSKANGAGKPISVTIVQSLTGTSGTLSRSVVLDFVSADRARSIDDIPLEKIGIKASLHATFIYNADAVRLEHALMIPGAVTIK